MATLLLANVFFAVCHPGLGVAAALPPLFRSLVVNAALFVVPGLGWTGVMPEPSRMLGMRIFRVVGLSVAAFLIGLIVVRVSGRPLTASLLWTLLWLLTDIGFATAARNVRRARPRRALLRREWIAGAVIFLSAYAFFFWGATRVVPAQEDQDFEVMGTGYGLLTRFEPLLLTDRHDVYFFAHPPLLHFLVGGSFLLHGSFDELARYDAITQRARRSAQQSPSGAIDPAVEEAELRNLYDRYNQQPHQLEARTPNVMLAAAATTLIALWAGRRSRRWWIGVLAAAAYATSPEVFVRSSYGGYYAIGAFMVVILLLAAERWRRWSSGEAALLLASACAAVSDHKLILLPAALALASAPAWLGRGSDASPRRVPVALIGFAGGLLVFWSWGLSIAPASFLRDHFETHLIDRVVHVNPLGYSGYPSVPALWIEFLRHTAYVLLPVGLVSLALTARATRRQADAARATAWLVYCGLTALVFSVIDWRQTKHLLLIVIPLVLGIVPARGSARWRMVAATTFVVTLAINLSMLSVIVRNFAAFTITPAW